MDPHRVPETVTEVGWSSSNLKPLTPTQAVRVDKRLTLVSSFLDPGGQDGGSSCSSQGSQFRHPTRRLLAPSVPVTSQCRCPLLGTQDDSSTSSNERGSNLDKTFYCVSLSLSVDHEQVGRRRQDFKVGGVESPYVEKGKGRVKTYKND